LEVAEPLDQLDQSALLDQQGRKVPLDLKAQLDLLERLEFKVQLV
jgi:hypothetical protein